MVKTLKQGARLVEKDAARFRQLDPASLAAEQLHVEVLLDRLDLLAERRLLHSEPLGGPGDVSFLGNGDEVSELPQVHSPYPVRMAFVFSALLLQ